jgi:hypothetical protein
MTTVGHPGLAMAVSQAARRPSTAATAASSASFTNSASPPGQASWPAWRELVREAPPAVLADTLGVSAGTAMRRAVLGGAD